MADGVTTLTIDRETRDMLRGLILWDASDFEGFHHSIEAGLRDDARALQAKLDLILALLDGVGWADRADLSRYEINVDADSFSPWLQAKRLEWETFIADDTATLAHQEAGHDGYYIDEMSQAESVAHSRRLIQRHNGNVEVITALIDRLVPAGAVTA